MLPLLFSSMYLYRDLLGKRDMLSISVLPHLLLYLRTVLLFSLSSTMQMMGTFVIEFYFHLIPTKMDSSPHTQATSSQISNFYYMLLYKLSFYAIMILVLFDHKDQNNCI